jgi:hypothetical protein
MEEEAPAEDPSAEESSDKENDPIPNTPDPMVGLGCNNPGCKLLTLLMQWIKLMFIC